MSKIIPFAKPEKDSGPVETSYSIKRKRPPWKCPHSALELNESTRLAICKHCGDALDPFDVLALYAEKQRKTKYDIAEWEAAKAEFEAIQAGWSLTIAEKRRIKKAMDQAYGEILMEKQQ